MNTEINMKTTSHELVLHKGGKKDFHSKWRGGITKSGGSPVFYFLKTTLHINKTSKKYLREEVVAHW